MSCMTCDLAEHIYWLQKFPFVDSLRFATDSITLAKRNNFIFFFLIYLFLSFFLVTLGLNSEPYAFLKALLLLESLHQPFFMIGFF
jgi:hypothetical protein